MQCALLLIAVATINGCVTEQRCFEKYGRIDRSGVEIMTRDTVIIHEGGKIDTFWVPESETYKLIGPDGIKKDTIRLRDTFYLNKENIKVRLVKHRDTIRVHVECPESKTVVPQTIIKREYRFNRMWSYLMAIIIVLGISAVIYFFTRKNV